MWLAGGISLQKSNQCQWSRKDWLNVTRPSSSHRWGLAIYEIHENMHKKENRVNLPETHNSKCSIQCRQQEGGATGAVCSGPPNSARLIQIRSGSSVTFQYSFFEGLVLLYFRLKSSCSFCFMLYTADTYFRLMQFASKGPARTSYFSIWNC